MNDFHKLEISIYDLQILNFIQKYVVILCISAILLNMQSIICISAKVVAESSFFYEKWEPERKNAKIFGE